MNNPSKEAKATKPAKPKFFHGVKAEFKKITWPDKELLLKQSVAVVAISIVLGAIIAVLDLIHVTGMLSIPIPVMRIR